jgi:hypothetical protein
MIKPFKGPSEDEIHNYLEYLRSEMEGCEGRGLEGLRNMAAILSQADVLKIYTSAVANANPVPRAERLAARRAYKQETDRVYFAYVRRKSSENWRRRRS